MKRLVLFVAILSTVGMVGCGFGGRGSKSSSSGSSSSPSNSMKVAFLSDRDGSGLYSLYYMDADGSGQTKVPLDSSFDGLVWDPEMSPDAGVIAFSRFGAETADLYSASLDGSTVLQLTSGADSYAPHFSPDGTQIVFIRVSEAGVPHVWTMYADGSAATDLTPDSTYRYSSARFSPDGSSIIAVRVADPNASGMARSSARPMVAGGGGNGNEIVTMNLDGSSLAILESVRDNNSGAQYSTDGSSLIYSIDGAYTSVVSEELSSHTRIQLTPSDSNNHNPLAAGAYIFFVSQRDGNAAVYRMNADGKNEIRLTTGSDNSILGAARH